jgi:hypothetical protein
VKKEVLKRRLHTFVLIKQFPKINNSPNGENETNLVTLLLTISPNEMRVFLPISIFLNFLRPILNFAPRGKV